MIPEYNRKSLLLGLPGLGLQIVCYALINITASGGAPGLLSFLPLLQLGVVAGLVLLVIGLCYYAKSKGYNALFGLLGLLSCLGLIILAVLPDKTKP
jgi:hypothetical protein